MLETLEQTDRSVTLFLNTFLDTAWSGPVWAFITDKHTWYPVYALLIVFLFWKMGWKRALVTLGAIALTILAADQLANVVKAATMRLRPCHDPWMIENGIELPIGKGGGKYGFFSAHAATRSPWSSRSGYRLRHFLTGHGASVGSYGPDAYGLRWFR